MSKYKYYFRKPKSEITKDILKWLTVSGMVYVAAGSPYLVLNLMRSFKKWHKYEKKRITDTFYKLRKEGCIEIEKRNHQVYIGLTEKGKKKAGWFQIDSLKIKKPKKWDGKWRIVIFDIPNLKGLYRNIFRGKLKTLGFYPLQKSVWITPFKCSDEINLIKDFLGLTDKEVRVIISRDIGKDEWFKEKFKV